MKKDEVDATFEKGILVEYKGGRVLRKDVSIAIPKQLRGKFGRLTTEEVNEAYTLEVPKSLNE